MNLFDPNRPKIGDRPALLWNGLPVCVVPQIMISPTQVENFYTLEVIVAIAPNTARWLSYNATSIHALMEDYINDPEATLMVRFNWNFTRNAEKRSVREKLSLEDLGDLE